MTPDTSKPKLRDHEFELAFVRLPVGESRFLICAVPLPEMVDSVTLNEIDRYIKWSFEICGRADGPRWTLMGKVGLRARSALSAQAMFLTRSPNLVHL